jgi:hypothetical protein
LITSLFDLISLKLPSIDLANLREKVNTEEKLADFIGELLILRTKKE